MPGVGRLQRPHERVGLPARLRRQRGRVLPVLRHRRGRTGRPAARCTPWRPTCTTCARPGSGDRLRLTLQVLGVDGKRLHILHEMLDDADAGAGHRRAAAGARRHRGRPGGAVPDEIAGRLAQIRAAHAGAAGARPTSATSSRSAAGGAADGLRAHRRAARDRRHRARVRRAASSTRTRTRSSGSTRCRPSSPRRSGARPSRPGLYAANMPAELGGGGLDAVGVTLAERELGWACYALQRLVARPSNILQACEGDQCERYLLPAIRGERHDCLAMTEPGAGSDVRVDDHPRRSATATTGSSTAPSTSSATPTWPTSSILFAATGDGADAPRADASAITALPGRPGHARADRAPRPGMRVAPRLPPLRAGLRRLPGARPAAARRGGPRLRPDGRVARRQPADGRRDQRRPGPAGAGAGHATGRPTASSSASRSAGSRASASSSPTWRPSSRPPSC